MIRIRAWKALLLRSCSTVYESYLVLNSIPFILGDYTDECMHSFKGYPKMFKGWFKTQQEARQ